MNGLEYAIISLCSSSFVRIQSKINLQPNSKLHGTRLIWTQYLLELFVEMYVMNTFSIIWIGLLNIFSVSSRGSLWTKSNETVISLPLILSTTGVHVQSADFQSATFKPHLCIWLYYGGSSMSGNLKRSKIRAARLFSPMEFGALSSKLDWDHIEAFVTSWTKMLLFCFVPKSPSSILLTGIAVVYFMAALHSSLYL